MAAVGAIAGIYKLGSDAAATGGEMQDLVDQLDISAEAMQRWEYFALQTGVSNESLTRSFERIRDNLGEIATGNTSAATEAIAKLLGGIKNVPKDAETAFGAIADAISKLEDTTEQAYYATEIFGTRRAAEMLPLLNLSSEAADRLNAEFEEMGYLTNEQVKSLADFDDELNIMKEKMELVKAELGMALLPLMEIFIDLLNDYIVPAIQKVAEWFEDLSEPMQNIIAGGLLLVGALSPVLFIFGKIIGVIPILIGWFSKLNIAGLKIALTFGAVLIAVGLIAGILKNWENMSGANKVIAILGALTVAAFGAAIAFGAMQSAWTLGLAAAGIVAGIALIGTAIASAKKDAGVDDSGNYSVGSIPSSISNENFDIPSSNNLLGTNTYSEDNSQYNIEINYSSTGNTETDAKALADMVIRELAVKKQASGR